MRRGRVYASFLVVVAILSMSLPVAAQDDVGIQASFGIGGYISSDATNPVNVRLAADTLVVGTLEIVAGATTTITEIEVPAGTTKDYRLVLPSAGSFNNAIVVDVRDRSGDIVATAKVSARFALDETLVGVVGDAALVAAVDNLTTSPFNIETAAFSVDESALAGPFDVLDYLVVDRSLNPAVTGSVLSWVKRGGRLVGTAEALGSLGVAVAPDQPLRLGSGAVAFDGLEVADGSLSTLALASVPVVVTTSFGEPFNEIDSSLFEASSFGHEANSLSLGWLATALVLYVLVVGPLNLYLLARIDRRDWAWVTVPALSLVGILVFAGLSSGSSESTRLRHASVVISEDGTTSAQTGILLAAGSEGRYGVSMGSGAQLTPFDAGRWFGGRTTESSILVDTNGVQTVSFDLAPLGVGSVRAAWEPEPIAVVVDGQTVVNDSGLRFEPWGVKTADGILLGQGTLEAGFEVALDDMASAARFANSFESPIADAVFSAGRFMDEEAAQTIWPLSWAATQANRDLLSQGTYFFGYTDQLEVDVSTNGSSRAARGNALVIVAIDRADASGSGSSSGSGSAELIAAPGAEHIEQYGPTFVYGADSVALRFSVPAATTGDFTLVSDGGPGLGQAEVIEAYDWSSSSFVEVEANRPFTSAGLVSPFGEVMVLLSFSGFGSEEILIETINLEWEAP